MNDINHGYQFLQTKKREFALPFKVRNAEDDAV